MLYGAGSVLVLSLNASTLGVFFASLGTGSLIYMPHAALEFFGFFTAAVAGGIISSGIEKHEFGTFEFSRVLKDASIFVLMSIILIVIAALVESSLIL